ncbi:hypothetical protein ACSAZL_13420 [Methanosarcina sp. T3]|uniref:hypothetical protein n=1 Tax=Methanosarcina sp. T3 TaxID=3439062 RepID=UPI003F85F05B
MFRKKPKNLKAANPFEFPKQNSRRITYDHQQEKKIASESFESQRINAEEARKAAEAHEYYKTLLGEEEEEDTVVE